MACQKCDYKGYIETYVHMHAGFRPAIKQCFNCNDVKAYSKRVQEMSREEIREFPPEPPKPRTPTRARRLTLVSGKE